MKFAEQLDIDEFLSEKNVGSFKVTREQINNFCDLSGEAIISISPLLMQYIPDLIPTEVVSIIIVAPNLSLKESLQYTCSSDPL